MMVIGSAALAGIFPLAGYYSKDMILETLHVGDVTGITFTIGAVVAFLTAFYSWRVLFLTFHGKPRASEAEMSHLHESPPVMLLPIFILTIGALVSGYLGYSSFVGENRETFWAGTLAVSETKDIIEMAHHVPLWVQLSPLFMSLFGIFLSWVFYRYQPSIRRNLVNNLGAAYRFALNKWYFDELYNKIFVNPMRCLGQIFSKKIDADVIDALIPHGGVSVSQTIGAKLSAFQNGQISHYGSVIFGGAVLIVLYVVIMGIMP